MAFSGILIIIAMLLFVAVVSVGVVIVVLVSNKKWGYTKEREQQLEEGTGEEQFLKKRNNK